MSAPSTPRAWPWLLLALGLSLVALWPLPAVFFTDALGHPYGDLADHYWGTWWFGGELLAGRLPLQTNLSHFPDQLSLWYVDPLGALLALPGRVLGFPADWNLLVLLQVFAATAAAWWLGWELTRCPKSALVAAMVAGPSPYLLSLVHSGLSEYMGVAPLALFALWLARHLGLAPGPEAPPPPAWKPALALGLAAWQAPYHLVFGVLYAACLVPGAGFAPRLVAIGRVVALGAAIALPGLVGSLASLGDGAAVTEANAPGWTGRLPATDVLTFVRPGDYYFPDTPSFGNPGILHVNYLGWVAVGLAMYAGWTRLSRASLLYGLLCLGPRLAVARWIVTVGGTSLLLPLGFLYFPGSPLGMVHQPYRMVAMAMPLLAMAAALGAAKLPAWGRLAAALAILAETLLVSPAPWPLATRPITPPAVYAELDPGPILDWPPDGSTLNRDYLVDATTHGQAVPYGVNVFLGETLRRDPLIDALLRSLDHLDRRATNRDVPPQGPILLRPKGRQTRLGELGFRWVVVHPAALSDAEWGKASSLLRAAFGEPTRQDAEAVVWAVP